MELSLAGLVHDFGFGLAEGPVRRTVVALEHGRSVTCVTTGLFLISDGEERLAALVVQGERGFGEAGLRLEVISREQEAGERFVADVRALMVVLERKAALHAARAGSPRLKNAHFREALDLLEKGGSITRAMLGADGGAVERLDAEDAWGEAEWDEE
jgi:hypothetical protein